MFTIALGATYRAPPNTWRGTKENAATAVPVVPRNWRRETVDGRFELMAVGDDLDRANNASAPLAPQAGKTATAQDGGV
jgi:hypothetical protein